MSQRQIKGKAPMRQPKNVPATRTSMNSYKQFILQHQQSSAMRNAPMRQSTNTSKRAARPGTARKPSVTHKRKSQSKLGDKKTKGTSSQRQLPNY